MPGTRAGAEGRIEEAIAVLDAALSKTGAPWMIIGGIAVIAHGVRRMTTDIDAAVRGDAISIDEVLHACAKHRIAPRIADAAAFARENLVLLLRHEPTGVDLDVSFAWSQFELDALDARTRLPFGRVTATMVAPDDLVVFKGIAGRPKDLEDLEALLILHPSIDVTRARDRLRELAEVAGVPEILHAFDAAVARARPDTRQGGRTLKGRTAKSRRPLKRDS